MKCDVIAQGIVNAAKGVGIQVPLVVRLEGTNVERGKEILKESGINITTAGAHPHARSSSFAWTVSRDMERGCRVITHLCTCCHKAFQQCTPHFDLRQQCRSIALLCLGRR